MDRRILVENIITFLPVIYKKFFNGFTDCSISRQQWELLYHLDMDGGKPMNYYGTKMMVSKPNLTVLANKLIDEGHIERDYLLGDRRVIILKLTQKGQTLLDEQNEKFKNHMLKKISGLSDDDVLRLNQLMEESARIVSKLQDND